MFYSWIIELMVVFYEKSREISFECNKIKKMSPTRARRKIEVMASRLFYVDFLSNVFSLCEVRLNLLHSFLSICEDDVFLYIQTDQRSL